ncbi:hypothetical protein [Mucisphaera sp.]|uniref:hypothetical protein n=1 Tax=Mucisphaera sp. TaxID=2913024 RepID=UPI003D0EA1BD
MAAATGLHAEIRIDVQQASLGFEGHLYPGLWSPVRVELENTGPRPIAVRLALPLDDADGDEVRYERVVTVDANRELSTWLYGMPPQLFQTRITIEAHDDETGVPLTEVTVEAGNPTDRIAKRILVLASGQVGLEDFTDAVTRHEPIKPIAGLGLEDLPDRAHGLDVIDAICWAPGGGDPASPGWTLAQQNALREWIRRGGHLVIVLPSAGQTWTATGLRDLLPVVPSGIQRVQAVPPRWLGRQISPEPTPVILQTLQPTEDASVLGTLPDGRPLLVARNVGLGRITMLGAEITDPSFRRIVADDGRFRVWHHIFGWQAPVLRQALIEQGIREGSMSSADSPVRNKVQLDQNLSAYADLTRSIGIWLNVLLILIVTYWLAAGPISDYLLRQRQRAQHTWLGFALVALLFAVASWTLVAFAGPTQSRIKHLSVIDIDAQNRLGRLSGWASIFTPDFGTTEIAFAAESDLASRLSSPGWPGSSDIDFLDTQSYAVSATEPDRLLLPSRGASRMIRYETLGPLDDLGWAATFHHTLRLDAGLPLGEVFHEAPAPLRFLQAIFLPLEETPERALVWDIPGDWLPGQPLTISTSPQALRLGRRVLRFDETRSLRNEGHLGNQLAVFPTRDGWLQTTASSLRPRLLATMRVLTFHDLLPAPRFHALDLGDRATVIQTGQLGILDLSQQLLPGHLMLIGLMEDAAIPADLRLNQRSIDAQGMTVVRLIYDLNPTARQAANTP